jgi:hypothetical protein
MLAIIAGRNFRRAKYPVQGVSHFQKERGLTRAAGGR